MITSSATGTSTKAWEFVKNYYKTNALNPKNVVVVNERAFARLPKDAAGRRCVEAAAAAEKRGWEMSKAREKEGDETLAEERHDGARARRRDEGRRSPRSASRWPRSGRRRPAPTARRSSKPTAASKQS